MIDGFIGFDEAAHEAEKLTAENMVEGFRAKEFRALVRKDFEEEAKQK